MALLCCLLLLGPIEFHRNSLQHLSDAMRRTRRLCATVIDTMGRELMVRGQWQVNDQVGRAEMRVT